MKPLSVQSIHPGKISAYLSEYHQCNAQPTSPQPGQCTLTEDHFNNGVGKGTWSGVSDTSQASPVHNVDPGAKYVSSHTSLINYIVTSLWLPGIQATPPYWNDVPVHKSCTLCHTYSYLHVHVHFNITNLEFSVYIWASIAKVIGNKHLMKVIK